MDVSWDAVSTPTSHCVTWLQFDPHIRPFPTFIFVDYTFINMYIVTFYSWDSLSLADCYIACVEESI